MPTPKRKPRKRPIVLWEVNIQMEVYDFRIKARTAAEAKKKAYLKLRSKGYAAVNKSQTYADKLPTAWQ